MHDGAPIGHRIHATAVAIGGHALVIVGASRSGKSSLAAALLAASIPQRAVELIGDDRVLLVTRRGRGMVARPHPRIAGFMERRGLGIVALAYQQEAPLGGWVCLDDTPADPELPRDLPRMALVDVGTIERRRDLVFEWWTALMPRQTEHSSSRKRG